MIPGFVKGTET